MEKAAPPGSGQAPDGQGCCRGQARNKDQGEEGESPFKLMLSKARR